MPTSLYMLHFTNMDQALAVPIYAFTVIVIGTPTAFTPNTKHKSCLYITGLCYKFTCYYVLLITKPNSEYGLSVGGPSIIFTLQELLVPT